MAIQGRARVPRRNPPSNPLSASLARRHTIRERLLSYAEGVKDST